MEDLTKLWTDIESMVESLSQPVTEIVLAENFKSAEAAEVSLKKLATIQQYCQRAILVSEKQQKIFSEQHRAKASQQQQQRPAAGAYGGYNPSIQGQQGGAFGTSNGPHANLNPRYHSPSPAANAYQNVTAGIQSNIPRIPVGGTQPPSASNFGAQGRPYPPSGTTAAGAYASMAHQSAQQGMFMSTGPGYYHQDGLDLNARAGLHAANRSAAYPQDQQRR